EPYPIDLEKDILDVTVRRDFMGKEYGGNPQETYPKIAPAFVEKTGMKYFMYLNLLYNPHCPEIPGAPGLLFDADFPSDSDDSDSESDSDDDEDKSETLFSRLGSGIWQYQGQYVKAPVAPLTLDEWKQQSPAVRRTWAKQLSIKGWGRSIRADIALRRQLGRKPTKAETKIALKSKDNFFNVTPKEISSAFNRGEVIIVVSTLQCVGYKTDFQRDLAAKMPFFVPKPRKQTTKKPASNRKGRNTAVNQGRVTSTSRGQKRKRREPESSSEEEDDDDYAESEEEEPSENIYRSLGTRSRPIRV
ncbi:hypothetical protein FB451DRAFT_1014745, partial [Mycena latifolia]